MSCFWYVIKCARVRDADRDRFRLADDAEKLG